MRRIAGTVLALLLACTGSMQARAATAVPLGGNAYVTSASPGATETIDDTGLHDWTSARTVISTYFHVERPGTLDVALSGRLAGATRSRIEVSLGDQVREVELVAGTAPPYRVGRFQVARPGYVKVDLRGVSTDGGCFGDVSELLIDGVAATGAVFADDPENFYWSRRGPSVHLGFDVPADTEYFYSQIEVPDGRDPVGTYYMANGFSGGYFGIQVNSRTERRVLFSIWDSPAGKTTLVRKGSGVTANDFGGEGTGGQSYLVHPWKAGTTYHFLTRAQPAGSDTLFTAWFGTPTRKANRRPGIAWKLIATWKYAGEADYLRSVYSFLEGFDPDTGHLGRSAVYANQWAISSSGHWTEMTQAKFTVDGTGRNRQRLDFAGGLGGGAFFLRNDGFFSGTVAPDQAFTRAPSGARPDVDFDRLP